MSIVRFGRRILAAPFRFTGWLFVRSGDVDFGVGIGCAWIANYIEGSDDPAP